MEREGNREMGQWVWGMGIENGLPEVNCCTQLLRAWLVCCALASAVRRVESLLCQTSLG